MADNSKKTSFSSNPGRLSTNNPLEPSKLSADEIGPALEQALAAGDDARALKILDSAPRWMNRQPEFMLIRASVLLSQGDDQQALRLLLEIERKNPQFKAVYTPLAMFYMDREWPAHALQAAKRAHADRENTDSGRASIAQIIEEATALIQSIATEVAMPYDSMLRAVFFNEQAQMSLDDEKLSEADHFCREAIKIAPHWNPPHNNRAQALYYLGKGEEAIYVSKEVLAREAENVFALSSLVTYHLGLNQPEQAYDYASRLGRLSNKLAADGMEIENVITALALVEDTPTLWKIAKGYLDASADSLFGRSWFCLAVAAIRSGKWNEALKLFEKADEEELPPAGKACKEELRMVAGQRHPRLAWMPPAYPGVDVFFHPKIIAEWDGLMKNLSSPPSPSQKRKIDHFFQRYPFIVAGMKRLLWDGGSNDMSLRILLDIERPDADAEILRFALSQTGNQKARLDALMQLSQTGRYGGPEIVDIWSEEREEWRAIKLNTQRIGDVKLNVRPETMTLIEKSQRAKDPAESISFLRKAIEKEPTSPIAIFNLGALLAQNGEVEEGEALIRHSVEVDPNYTFGHASIALSAVIQGNEQEALEHLEVVTRADVITQDTAMISSLAWMMIFLNKNDIKTARQHYETAFDLNPEHRLVKQCEKILKEAEDYYDTFGYLMEYQRKSAQRAHQKLLRTPLSDTMNLQACLATNTKDMLVGSARFLRTSSSGVKGELVSRLAEDLLDEEFLGETLEEDLTKREREALQWMLEADGVRPWKEIVGKYGDDEGESTAWNYHQPESVPGRLRLSGLFYSGTLGGQTVGFIPADVRPLLHKLLK